MMLREIIIIITTLLLLPGATAHAALQEDGDDEPKREVIPIRYTSAEGETRTQHFYLEVAADSLAISRGLSGRKEIREDGGMLFVYPSPGQRSYWMKNCLVDIDIIFLDGDGKVVRTYEMKKEPLRRPGEEMWRYEGRLQRYRSVKPAQFVIELRAGWLKKLGIERGDRIGADWKRIARHLEGDGRWRDEREG